MRVRHNLTFDELVEKVKRQEETITQLIKIVAATNHRLTDFITQHEAVSETNLVN